MKEEYLHLIWKLKRLPFHLMKLTNGQEFTLKSTGIYNLESGPDFFDGEIIIDSICWRGNIEIHVKSSDWNLHKHQNDRAYDNVILHVVLHHDEEIIINNRIIPTLELKEFLEQEHYENYLEDSVQQSVFVCEFFLADLDEIYLESMKERAIHNRLNRKIKFLDFKLDTEIDFSQILYLFLAKAFGMKVNSVPFQELANRLPLKILKRESQENFSTLIFGVSGHIDAPLIDKRQKINWHFYQEKYKLNSMELYVWKKKGLRPKGFPSIRLFQFSEVIRNCDFNTTFTYFDSSKMLDYFHAVLTISNKNNILYLENSNLEISNSTKEAIILNCFVPFLWWFGTMKNSVEMKEKAIDILLQLKPEKNSITLKWNKLGVKIKKAYDSQALLEIYNEFCSKKKCLSCTVGDKIIRT